MNFSVLKNSNIKLNLFQRWALFILSFILSFLISQHFCLLQGSESTLLLSLGIVFLMYVISPRKQWIYIFAVHIVLIWVTALITHHDVLLHSISEPPTSIFTASLYLFIKKRNQGNFKFQNILILPLASGIGSLFYGLICFISQFYIQPQGYHSNLFLTCTFSGMIGILLMPQHIVNGEPLHIRSYFQSLQKQLPELLILIISTLFVTNLIFSNKFTDINLAINFPYLLLPFILWAAIRFHPIILSILLLGESLLILQFTKNGLVPFEQERLSFYHFINSIQIFLLFTIEFSHIIADIIVSRNTAQEKIKKMNESLEAIVNQRTFELKHALEALSQSEEQFREAFDTAMHGMALIGLDGSFLRVNQALCDMIGYEKRKLLSSSFRKISLREDYASERKSFRKLVAGKLFFYQTEKRLLHRDKFEVWVIESNSLITSSDGKPLHIVSQIIDITERKQSEDQLKKYSETLTVLLREVNHRVKNNLSALIGMLHLEEDQAEKEGKTEYIHLLQDLISRITGLATVHSMLSAINWQPLDITQLCEQIILSVIYGLPIEKKVSLKIAPSPIKINSNQAHHLAIVLNELATNTVKYGLSVEKENIIRIFIFNSDGKIVLIYKDNGPGYPENLINGDYSNVNIGFELIRGIITQSLDGIFDIHNDNGAVIEIAFPNELI